MNPPLFNGLENLEQYLCEMAQFLAETGTAPLNRHGLLLARVLPNMTAEHWQALSKRHDLRDWHVVPLPDAAPRERRSTIMVRADEKKFLFSGCSS